MTAGKDRNTSESSVSDDNSRTSRSAKRLEELLVEDKSARVSFKDLTEQEVRSHKRHSTSLIWLLILMVVIFVFAAAVWYLNPRYMSHQPEVTVEAVQVEKRMPVPARPQEPLSVVENGADDPGQAVAGNTQETVADSAEPAADNADDALGGGGSDSPTNVPSAQSESPVEAVQIPVDVLEIEAVDTNELVQGPSASAEQPTAQAGGDTVAEDEPLYRVEVGPIVSNDELERATALLIDKGFRPRPQPGTGTVDMIRLLEGIYPLAQAQERLAQLRAEFPTAFILPDGDRWALYIGSFSDRDRARSQQRTLAERDIQVAQVDSQLTMSGTLLIVAHADEMTAEGIAAEIRSSGLRARIEIER